MPDKELAPYIVKDPVQDRLALSEYLETVLKNRRATQAQDTQHQSAANTQVDSHIVSKGYQTELAVCPKTLQICPKRAVALQ